jgi:hypothetical protein
MEARNVIFYDERGRPVRVAGVNVDITEKKRALVQVQAFTESRSASRNGRERSSRKMKRAGRPRSCCVKPRRWKPSDN